MPHNRSSKTFTSARITPATFATNSDFERFLGNCCDDTRRRIFRHLGLPKRKKRPWAEFWNAVGLEPDQPEELWDLLTLGSNVTNSLWNAARVAEETGLAVSTVNSYCHKNKFPDGFPGPLIDAGPKARFWLPLDVRAYVRPSLYRDRHAMIRRKPKRQGKSRSVERIQHTSTMQPLPPRSENTE